MTNRRSAVIILDKSNILLIHRVKNGEEYYVIPGGTVEKGETPEKAAVREAKEETNLDIDLGGLFWEDITDTRHDYYFISKSHHGNLKLGGPEATRNNENDSYQPEWVSLERLKEITLYPTKVSQLIQEKYTRKKL